MPLAVGRDRGPLGFNLTRTECQPGSPASSDPVLGDPFALYEYEDFLPGPSRKPGDFGGFIGGVEGGGLTAVKGGGLGRVRLGSRSKAQLFQRRHVATKVGVFLVKKKIVGV